MATCSMILVGVLNIIITISAMIAIIVCHSMPAEEYPCKNGSTKSMSQMGSFAFLVGIIGLLGTCCRSKGLQYVYLWMLLISTISSVAFFTFVNAMLPETNAYNTYHNNIEGYYLEAYKPMLRKALVNDKDWYDQSDCFRKKMACDVLVVKAWSKENYIKEGCCKPPHRCGMVLVNNTSWGPRSTGLLSEDEGCKKWAEHGGLGCYECDECKAGYLGVYQQNWQNNFNLMAGVISFAVVVSLISYYAIKVEKPDEEQEEEEEEQDMNKASRILHHRL